MPAASTTGTHQAQLPVISTAPAMKVSGASAVHAALQQRRGVC